MKLCIDCIGRGVMDVFYEEPEKISGSFFGTLGVYSEISQSIRLMDFMPS